MISFIVALVLLVLGYIFYGRLVERVFQSDAARPTPVQSMADGTDYVSMPWWKIFLIQFLNIAGLGPIFGAIMGVMFGPAAFLWIVFGSIFGGAVHDYLSGMLSLRQNGASLPEVDGSQLGTPMRHVVRVLSIILLMMITAVFVSGPADILNELVPSVEKFWWVYLVFIYYILATLLPIDKIVGRIYPFFGCLILFMAVGVLGAMIWNRAPIPEVWNGLGAEHPKGFPIFPMMFISIACGAVSGFHATQSPMMARCMENERYGRPCFYGAMIAEGVVALIWAAAASSFWGSVEGLNEYVASLPADANVGALAVNKICNTWLGPLGGVLAVLGVAIAPITTGDTALRSARLVVADIFKFSQSKVWHRLAVSLPLFALTFLLMKIDFQIIWRYNAFLNQTLATITLWATAVYLSRSRRCYWIALLPACFMTFVCTSYLFYAPECYISLPLVYCYLIGATEALVLLSWFLIADRRSRRITQ